MINNFHLIEPFYRHIGVLIIIHSHSN